MSDSFFFTADLHFGHRLIVELRGFDSIEKHDDAILEALNTTVSRGDNLFILGDFMLPFEEKRAAKLLRDIPGTKHLIFGNHDPRKLGEIKEWASVNHIRARKTAGIPIFMCHYACRSWPGMGRGAMHLYGHSHGNLAPGYGRSMDVGVDTRPDFTPWSIDEVVELLLPVEPLIVDHHGPDEGEGDEVDIPLSSKS